MNISLRIISVFCFTILFVSYSAGQTGTEEQSGNFDLKINLASGINYTYESNLSVAGTYKKNSVPILAGIELLYKKSIGFEITGGYFPIMFYSDIKQYKKTEISIDASLISYPVTFSLKYHLSNFSIAAGGSFCIIKSDISITNSGTEAVKNSFGYYGAAAYEFPLYRNFMLSPGIVYYNIPEVNSSVLSFQIKLIYDLIDF